MALIVIRPPIHANPMSIKRYAVREGDASFLQQAIEPAVATPNSSKLPACSVASSKSVRRARSVACRAA